MTADPKFQPVFGPNGAVLNAPSMTPEMRAKIDEVAKTPSGADVLRSVRFFALITFATLLILSVANPLRQFLIETPLWANVVTGTFALIALICLAWCGLDLLRRWEFLGADQRTLRMPAWARVTLLTTDFFMAVGGAGGQVSGLTDLSGERWPVTMAFFAVLFVAAMIGWLMRALADQCKWTWRQPA